MREIPGGEIYIVYHLITGLSLSLFFFFPCTAKEMIKEPGI